MLRTKNRIHLVRNGMLAIALLSVCGMPASSEEVASKPKVRGAILAANDVTDGRLQELGEEGFNSVVLLVEGNAEEQVSARQGAAKRINSSSLGLCYWIEVARCPELADAHPAWMASLQTHDEWRRLYPDAPKPTADQVMKTYPWVPILSREPFTAQLNRIEKLLAEMPPPAAVYLNDLQGAPSACGCGNTLCRWTSDYGKRRTTVPLGDDAATLFVEAVKKVVPNSEVIPVWTTECEKHDGATDGQCAGVGCYDGICWKAYVKQLAPLAQANKHIGALAPYRAFKRDLPIYGEPCGWIRFVVESFAEMPKRHGADGIDASRLTLVLQGWDVGADDVAKQISVATESGVSGYVVAFTEIQQDWKPKLIHWR
ncbi:MAG: hypothetical protein KDB27_12460 [Planctomycetales bacterium]|nr:hypothetical protein [Planctomycetales bacterium]